MLLYMLGPELARLTLLDRGGWGYSSITQSEPPHYCLKIRTICSVPGRVRPVLSEQGSGVKSSYPGILPSRNASDP